MKRMMTVTMHVIQSAILALSWNNAIGQTAVGFGIRQSGFALNLSRHRHCGMPNWQESFLIQPD